MLDWSILWQIVSGHPFNSISDPDLQLDKHSEPEPVECVVVCAETGQPDSGARGKPHHSVLTVEDLPHLQTRTLQS